MLRAILVTYASSADDTALARAVALAHEHRARLTIAVPVTRPARLAGLAFVDLERLRGLLEEEAAQTARRAMRQVPADVSLVVRCVPREREPLLVREIVCGAWDLCVAYERSQAPAGFWGGFGRRLARRARRSGVATLLVAEPAREGVA